MSTSPWAWAPEKKPAEPKPAPAPALDITQELRAAAVIGLVEAGDELARVLRSYPESVRGSAALIKWANALHQIIKTK